MNEENKVGDGTDWREGHRTATCTVELIDHGPEPDWHRDRTVFAPWARYELVARNPAVDELAQRKRGMLVSARRRASKRDALDQMTPIDRRAARTPDARLGLPIDVNVMPTPAMRSGRSRIDQPAAGPRAAASPAAPPVIPPLAPFTGLPPARAAHTHGGLSPPRRPHDRQMNRVPPRPSPQSRRRRSLPEQDRQHSARTLTRTTGGRP